jgi:hypothetical protein
MIGQSAAKITAKNERIRRISSPCSLSGEHLNFEFQLYFRAKRYGPPPSRVNLESPGRGCVAS